MATATNFELFFLLVSGFDKSFESNIVSLSHLIFELFLNILFKAHRPLLQLFELISDGCLEFGFLVFRKNAGLDSVFGIAVVSVF